MMIEGQSQPPRQKQPLILRWLVSAFGLWVADWLVEGIHLENFGYALLAAAVIGIINAVLKPILMLLSLPFILLTLGLFLIVINAVLLLVAGDIVPGFKVDGFWPAVWGSLIMSAISMLFNSQGNGGTQVRVHRF